MSVPEAPVDEDREPERAGSRSRAGPGDCGRSGGSRAHALAANTATASSGAVLACRTRPISFERSAVVTAAPRLNGTSGSAAAVRLGMTHTVTPTAARLDHRRRPEPRREQSQAAVRVGPAACCLLCNSGRCDESTRAVNEARDTAFEDERPRLGGRFRPRRGRRSRSCLPSADGEEPLELDERLARRSSRSSSRCATWRTTPTERAASSTRSTSSARPPATVSRSRSSRRSSCAPRPSACCR